jgi:2-hydroxy-6-oxonona-2,4-dienedioate hydrolase
MRRSGRVLLVMVVAAIGTAGLVFLHYYNELDHARAAAGSGGAIVSTLAGPIEYAERGTGLPLVSIHGAGGGYDQGLTLAADLVGDGFRVIAPSRFGYLRTPVPRDASPAAQADAHAALLSKLNVSKAIVFGVSAGARSAIEFVIKYPNRVTALILVVPGTYSPISPVSVEASRGSRVAFWVVNAGADFAWWAMEKIAPSVLIRFVGVRPELVTATARAEQDRVMSFVRSVEPLSRRFPGINVDSTSVLRELPLQEITAPTLIVSARDDLFNTLPAAEFAARRISNAELVVYDTGGHLLVGREQELRDVVRTFLARASLASPPNATTLVPGGS